MQQKKFALFHGLLTFLLPWSEQMPLKPRQIEFSLLHSSECTLRGNSQIFEIRL